MEKKGVRRGPGRPRKISKKTNIPKEGIVTEPYPSTDPNDINCMELVYDNPLMMKKIFALFKAMSVGQINICFTKEGVNIITDDRLQKNTIFVQIHGKELNRYYCENPFVISVDPAETQKVMQTIDKDYTIFSMVSSRFNHRNKINIILHHGPTNSKAVYELDIIQTETNAINVEKIFAEETDYPLHFQLQSKFFKKYINNCAILTDKISIEKHGLQPLHFYFQSPHGKVASRWFFCIDNIQLQSTIKEGDIFAASIFITVIKPMSASLLSDKIHVSVDSIRPAIFTAYLDKKMDAANKEIDSSQVCTIKIITELINYSVI